MVAKHPVPAGSTIRTLAIGIGAARQAAHVTWQAADKLAGYAIAFGILDLVIRQLSEHTIQHVPASDPTIVTAIVRLP